MADIFTQSGSLTNVGTPAPILQGVYIPSIDNPDALDGFGLVTPWGAGKTARRVEYGLQGTADPSRRLMDLWPADNITYKFAGLDGPQGPPGPPGPPGKNGANAIGLTTDPATHNQVSSTTDGDSATLQVAGSEVDLESVSVNSRGNDIQIDVYCTLVSTAGVSRDVVVRIYDDTGASAIYTAPAVTLAAGAELFVEHTTIHTPGVQANTYTFQGSVDVDGADVVAKLRGIILFESFV
jgi:hypothetical protein